MATVRQAMSLQDQVSPVLSKIMSSMRATMDVMQQVNVAAGKGIPSSNFNQAQKAIEDAERALEQFNSEHDNIPGKQDKIKKGFSGWQKAIIVANQALQLVKNTLGRLGIFDFGKAFGRMDTMKNFDRTMTIITGSAGATKQALNEINGAVKGTAYGLDVAAKATQNFVTRGVGLQKSVDQVRIWGDAVAFYGQGTNDQFETVMDAMGKMRSKGKVEMNQLDRMTDAGINAVGIYAKATGMATGTVSAQLSKGQISSAKFLDTVSKAMDEGTNGVLKISGAAKEAGATWATTFANMRAASARGLISIIEGFDKGLKAAGLPTSMEMIKNFGVRVEEIMTNIGTGLSNFMGKYSILVNFVVWAFKSIVNSIVWVMTSLDKLWPLLLVVGAIAVLAWWTVGHETEVAGKKVMLTGKQMIVAGWQGFQSGLKAAAGWIKLHWQMLAVIAVIGIAIWAFQNFSTWGKYVLGVIALIIGAIIIWKVVQWALNSAMLANPLVWILLAIILVLVAVIAIFIMFSDTAIEALGNIVGAVFVLGAAIWNTVVGVINAVIQFLWTCFVEPWIGIIEWVLNVFNGGFNSFGDGVKNLLGNIISWFLSLGQVVTKIIDAIFGTNWTGGLESLKGNVLAWGKNENAITLSREGPAGLNRMEYGKSWDSGVAVGEKMGNAAVNAAKGLADMLPEGLGESPGGAGGSGMEQAEMSNNPTGGKLDKVNEVGLGDEELRYLKDIARVEYINRYTTSRPTVNVKFGDVRETADVNGVIAVLESAIAGAYDAALDRG